MSAASREERLVTFEVAGAAYAIPIADVLEVLHLVETRPTDDAQGLSPQI